MKPIDSEKLLAQVGRRVGELRAERELTQEQLAETLGVSARYVQSIESGAENLGLSTIAKLATALNVIPIKLFEPPARPKAKPGRPSKQS